MITFNNLTGRALRNVLLRPAQLLILPLIFGIAGVAPASAQVFGLAQLEGVDRPGQDYRNFSLSEANPMICRNTCARESQCRAWTYVRPGVQGASARCWLKNRIPERRNSTCCTSGVFNVLNSIQSCRAIGNIAGQGPVTCVDEGGRNFGKAGSTFLADDSVFILARFRRLLQGKKKVFVSYRRWRDGGFRNFSGNRKTLTLENGGASWAWWFPAHFTNTGRWQATIALEGDGWEKQLLGQVEYCIGCVLE